MKEPETDRRRDGEGDITERGRGQRDDSLNTEDYWSSYRSKKGRIEENVS